MKGIGVSPGIAIGRAWVLRPRIRAGGDGPSADRAVGREIENWRTAVSAATVEVEEMMGRCGASEAEILGIQLELLQDPRLEEDVLERIDRGQYVREAVSDAIASLVRQFRDMEDVYLRERAADIQDIGNRLLRTLDGEAVLLMPETGEWIVIAEDLSPSETIGLDSRALAFATQSGGVTSHAAIVARLRGLPAVVGCGPALETITHEDMLALDGSTGVILVNPDASVLEEYRIKKQAFEDRRVRLRQLKGREAVTRDGTRISLLANIATAADMELALDHGAEGVGLLRTELLFMDHDRLPTEEEQFAFYKSILLRSGGRPVTIRTLDVGGDKPLVYLGLPQEANPFLGYRAIRISLDRTDLFKTQLRAILRASIFGNCRIMFPMIGSVEELIQAKAILESVRSNLRASDPGVMAPAFDPAIPIGVMIETPAAALTADLLARESDFFSIGTNDLIQYTLAVDRMNEKIAHLYDPFHPAVLRLIREVIGQGHRRGIPVGMCGELAGDPGATELLLKMGLKEFSMTANAIPAVKEVILKTTL